MIPVPIPTPARMWQARLTRGAAAGVGGDDRRGMVIEPSGVAARRPFAAESAIPGALDRPMAVSGSWPTSTDDRLPNRSPAGPACAPRQPSAKIGFACADAGQ
jgi:hypothetical protein